ncbi:MAG TPA: Kiwa anti-phage protein KwaB-like domain-containing protein [Candidatus Saccharimonadales bacterium]
MEQPNNDDTDVFLWATNTEPLKDELKVELYFFDKHYAVYTVNFAENLKQQIKKLFLTDMLRYVHEGAAKGMSVRDFEMSEKEDNVLQRTALPRVEYAADVISTIEEAGADLELFAEDQHEFKGMKAIIACFSHEKLAKPFYIVKLIKQAQVLKGDTAWMFSGNSFKTFDAAAGLRVMPDRQVLIIDGTIFVFDEAKFESLFKYNAKLQHIAHQKVAEIEANYQLVLPEEMTLQSLLKGKKRLVKKLQEIDMTVIKQKDLVEHADELGIELMLDDLGNIIIMDGKDLDKFVNLLHDDYVTSELTGNTYEIKSKKLVEKNET